ncbi:MAG: IS1182 family transposase [Dehalococcoidia bacterium]
MFPDLPEGSERKPVEPTRPQDARVVRPMRNQIQFLMQDLNATLPEDHQARAIWDFLDRLDLSAFYASIRAVEGGPGRPASDPQVLLALWVYATVEGVGSARKLARLCREHDAFRWLCGGVPVDYHLLSDFRVEHQEALDELLTQIVATLMAENLVTLEEVAQDGVRVRTSAGSGSFRRKARLEEFLEAAQARVERLTQEREHPDPGLTRRERAARERAARERLERVEHALSQLPEVQAAKERQAQHGGKARQAKLKEARVSTTDPEARVMKMADGGFRPAYNVQLATDVESQVIVGVAVTNRGTDQGEGLAVEEQVAQRTGQHPGAYLVDGGFVDLEDIGTLEGHGVRVYAPPKRREGAQGVPWRPGTKPKVLAWRERMGTEEGQATYKHRASTAECVNALARERHGVQRFKVWGVAKVTCITLLVAITHDLLRWITLGG